MRILLIKLSSLGDLFHILPAVHYIKTGLDADIHWVTQSNYVELVNCFSDVNRVIPFHRAGFLKNIRPFIQDLRTDDYDLILDFQGIWKSAIPTCLARGKKRIGPSFNREGTRLIYSAVAGPKNKNRHAIDQALDFVRYLELPIQDPKFPVAFPKRVVQEPRPRVAFAPFSRWPSKNWPTAYFVALGKELREQMNASVFLVGGSEDAAVCATMEQQMFAVNMAGKLSLPELCGFLNEMDLVISNDSGPLHMAAALGIPTLSLFGPTDPLKTAPRGATHQTLQAKLKCIPCKSRICRFNDASCLSVLAADMVGNVAMQMLHNKNMNF